MNGVNLFEHHANAERLVRAVPSVPIETPLQFAMRFIQSASLSDCFTIAVTLSNRLFTLEKQHADIQASNLNEAAHFVADAALNVQAVVSSENEEPALCAQCNGSGEGQYDGTHCGFCKGSGTGK